MWSCPSAYLLHHEEICRVQCAAPWIPNLNTRWRSTVSLKFQLIYPEESNPDNHWQVDWLNPKLFWTQWWRQKFLAIRSKILIHWSSSPDHKLNYSKHLSTCSKDITTKIMLCSTLFSNTADLYYINNSAGKSSLVGKLVCVPYFCTDTVATSHDRFTISFIGNSG